MSDVLSAVPATHSVDTGVHDTDKIAKALCDVVADTYRLIFKTHAYHWNVEGPLFYSIHKLTEEQYEEMFAAVDEVAERVRALGHLTPMTLTRITGDSVIQDLEATPCARDMVADLARDHERVAHRLHAAIEIAEAGKDDVTADLLTGRSAFHERAVWMLRAIAAD